MESTRDAFLFPSSARPRIRILLQVEKAVSADEKKAERITRMIKMINSAYTTGGIEKDVVNMTLDGSKIISPLLLNYS